MTVPPASSKPPPAASVDVDSIDAIVSALYSAVSFEEGLPDWDRFRSLFHAEAVMVRIDPDQAGGPLLSTDVEAYIARIRAAIDSGAVQGFVERELTRRTEVFGDVAQVFSTYVRSAEAGQVRRGINSMALVKDGLRWWMVSLSWTDETDACVLPTRYLPRS